MLLEMDKRTYYILSTRPVGSALTKRAGALSIAIDERNFIETKPVINPETADFIKQIVMEKANVIFTSMNAVEAVAEQGGSPAWNIYCIGYATKQLVAKHFPGSAIRETAEDAGSLADKIIEKHRGSSFTFFCGNQRRDELPGKIRDAAIDLKEVIVYETMEVPAKIDKGYDGILFFSPSAVHSFFKLNTPPANTILFAIGNTTADAIRSYSRNEIVIADEPGKDKLLDQAIEFFTRQKIKN